MSNLNSRIAKLEREVQPAEQRPIIMHWICSGGPAVGKPVTKSLYDAIVPGVGRIYRTSETEHEFRRLAYAMSGAGKHIDDRSAEELTKTLVAADARIVRESEVGS